MGKLSWPGAPGWAKPKIHSKTDLTRPPDTDRLTGVIGVDGSLMPVQVRDGLPSVHYGYAQAAATWLDIEAMQSQRQERFVDPVVLHKAVNSALVSVDLQRGVPVGMSGASCRRVGSGCSRPTPCVSTRR